MPKVIADKSDRACFEALLKRGRIVRELPFINSCIIETDDEGLRAVCLKEGGRVCREMGVSAQIERAKEKINCQNLEGLTGKGITAAVLDTGLAPILDFSGRIVAFKDIIGGKTTPYDDNSHGTHVTGILGGGGRLKGLAPEVNIAAVKVLDGEGRGTSAELLEGLSWVYENRKKYNIRLVNLSVGAGGAESFDPLVSAVEALWDNGVVVVSAAGNEGPAPGSVTSPGTSKKIITVGCLDDDRSLSVWNSEIKDFSGRGPTKECVVKPDVLAPGALIYSCSNTGDYIPLSGTSMSTPIVSGAIALLLEKHPNLTPDQVKYLIKITSEDLNCPKNRQGWGLINAHRLVNTDPIYI